MARQIGIPTGPLAVLDGEELLAQRGAQEVALAGGIHRIEGVSTRLGDGLRISPAQGITLIDAISNGCTAILIVATVSHNVPAAGIVAVATSVGIVGIIEVGQTEYMRELMGNRTDTLDSYRVGGSLKAVQLGRAGIAVNLLAVQIDIRTTQVRGMRPQVASIVARETR